MRRALCQAGAAVCLSKEDTELVLQADKVVMYIQCIRQLLWETAAGGWRKFSQVHVIRNNKQREKSTSRFLCSVCTPN